MRCLVIWLTLSLKTTPRQTLTLCGGTSTSQTWSGCAQAPMRCTAGLSAAAALHVSPHNLSLQHCTCQGIVRVQALAKKVLTKYGFDLVSKSPAIL